MAKRKSSFTILSFIMMVAVDARKTNIQIVLEIYDFGNILYVLQPAILSFCCIP